MNFQSFNLDLKDTNDLVFFNSSEREVHILGPIKEKVSIPIEEIITSLSSLFSLVGRSIISWAKASGLS